MATIRLQLTFSLLLLFSFTCKAVEEWNKGVIYLNTNETIYGEINYNQDFEIVQCKTEKGIKAFSTYNAHSFRYYDKKFSVYRVFKVFEEKKGYYKKRIFYEVVLEGYLSMLRRKKYIVPTNSYLIIDETPLEEREYDYYLYAQGKVRELRKFKKLVLNDIMKDKKTEVLSYIEAQKLEVYFLKDQILIIDFYNSLKDPDYVLISKYVN
jgi:hypothetical protein